MTVKIFFNGTELHVPTGDVAAVMRQLQELSSTFSQSVPTRAESQMPVAPRKFVENQVENVAQKQQRLNLTPSKTATDLALSFLKAIKENEQYGGLDTTKVMAVLDAAHPKGIGSKSAGINKLIQKCGYMVESVYTNHRGPLGDRVWLPGPAMPGAILAIEKGENRA